MAVNQTTLDGFFKNRYEDKLRDIVPEFSDYAESIKFSQQDKTGDYFIFDVRVRRSHGMTWGGSSADVFSLNDAVSGQTKPGQQRGFQAVLREQVAYGVVTRAQNTKDGFGNAFDEVVRDMRNAMSFYRELNIIYGGDSIGTIVAGGLGSVTTATISITEASWAPGVWAQMEGAWVDVYSAPGGTQRNTNAAVVITNVDFDNRQLSISGNATDLNAITANDVIIPYGADGNWFDGLVKLVPNTGVMHNINAATYGLWRGNTVNLLGTALSFAKAQQAGSRVAFRGGMGKLTLRVSPFTWADLNNDQAALRRYAAKAKTEADLGSEKLVFYGQTGEIEIKPHAMMKAGQALMTMDKYFKRIGSTDITFRLPGVTGQQDRFFLEIPGGAGFELRQFWDQALVSLKPACSALLTGIINTQSA